MRFTLLTRLTLAAALLGIGCRDVIAPPTTAVGVAPQLALLDGGDGGEWTFASDMLHTRYGHMAATGRDGRIFVFGGASFSTDPGAEVFDPSTGAWSAIATPGRRLGAAIGRGSDGRIYIAGGQIIGSGFTSQTVAYDPGTDSYAPVTSMSVVRYLPAFATGLDGRFYVIGGRVGTGGAFNLSAEVYDPAANSWTTIAAPSLPHYAGVGATGQDGRIYVFGGYQDATFTISSRAEAYDPATNTWTILTDMPHGLVGPAAATRGNGQIYVFGGVASDGVFTNAAQAYDPSTSSWSTVSSMNRPRLFSAAAMGADGTVYVTGGSDAGGPQKSVEIYQTAPATPPDPTPTGRSCKAIKQAHATAPSGVYTIDPDDDGPIAPVPVNCEMTRDGGGWTLGLKSWYQGGVFRNTGAVGSVGDGTALKGNGYKLSDEVIRGLIGPSMTFDVMADQSGYNHFYSTGNFEYVVLRNYTATWRFDAPVAASVTQTVMQSYRASDNALAWTGELSCGFGGAGINCLTVVSNNPAGGAGCTINMGTTTNAGWHHFYMSETNSDSYLYICNGAQHSSSMAMNHRWWFREAAAADDSPPVIAPSVTGTLGADGWYTSAVSVDWTVTDAESEIASEAGCSDLTITTDQDETTYTCSATSAGGSASESVTIKIDQSVPTVSGAVVGGTLGLDGWYTDAVTIAWTTSASGPSSRTFSEDCFSLTLTKDSAGRTFTCTLTTGAGIASAQGSLTVKRDATVPVVSGTVLKSSTLGHDGWYTGDVTIAWTSSAPGPSGQSADCANAILASDSPGTTFTCTVTTGAGVASVGSLTVKRDASVPTVSGAVVSGTEGDNGWYTSDVTIEWTPSPAGPSGISMAAECANVTLTSDSPGTTFTCMVKTGAGLSSEQASLTVKRDATAPLVGYSGNAGTYTPDQTVSITCSASDALSGLASSTCANISAPAHMFAIGANSVSATVTDAAGNSASASSSFTVVNVAPTVSALTGATILQGESHSIGGSFTDPGADSHTGTVNWGDGSIEALPLTGGAFARSHTFPVAGTFTVTVTVTDNHGAVGTSVATVEVLSPAGAAAALGELLNELLADTTITEEVANQLGTSVDAVLASLAAGKATAASGQLGAFDNKVRAALRSGKISSATADALLEYSARLRASFQ